MKFLTTVSVFVFLLCGNLAHAIDCAQVEAEFSTIAAQVNRDFEINRVADKIPGITYAAFNEQCLLFSGVVGTGDRAGTQPLSADSSLFRLASVSKLFAALSIMQLVEQGVLSLDTSLIDLERAEFVRVIKATDSLRLSQWSQIKIRHLLSHQAGISKDVPGALVFFNSESILDNAYPGYEELLAGLKDVEFLYSPGVIAPGLKYSNLNMNLLARLVEAYNPEGLVFPDYVKHHILLPSGMTETFYDLVDPTDQTKLTMGYGYIDSNQNRLELPKVYRVGAYDGSIGVASSAKDLARLGMQFFKLLARQESPLLRQEASVTNWFTPVSRFVPSTAWAMGPLWQTLPGESPTNPEHAVWTGHTGTGFGERAVLLVSPEKNLGLAVLLNTADANREKYAKIISDAVQTKNQNLPASTKALVADARAFLASTVPMAPETPSTTVPREQLEKFVGFYYADIVGKMPITISADGHLSLLGNKLVIEDLGLGKFRFPATAGPLFNREPIWFQFDATGKVTGARIAQVKILQKVE